MASVSAPADARKVVGRRLRDIRKDKGITTMQLAIALGMTQGNIEQYEAGRNGLSLEMFRRFARALNMHPNELHNALYDGIDESFRPEREAPLGAVGMSLVGAGA